MISSTLAVTVLVIVVALVFDFLNGFHDAANSIATVVSTRVLSPVAAVAWAAFFNFAAFLVFDVKVASTIGKGVVDPLVIDSTIIFSALIGAILWNILTWYFGLPSSSSHALVGGLAGAAVAKDGVESLILPGIAKIAVSIVLSPLLGLVSAALIMMLVAFLASFSTPRKIDRLFRLLQLLSAALYSLGHGGNDAQKTMGIITALLFINGYLSGDFFVPLWVVLLCHATMGLGTLCGGWRIVKTMGLKITKLKPVGGFCAELAGAGTLFTATHLGIPVSTTHTITGSIIGVGTVTHLAGIRWEIARQIVLAWLLTIPCAAFTAALCWLVINLFQA